MIGNGFFLINGNGFRMSISLFKHRGSAWPKCSSQPWHLQPWQEWTRMRSCFIETLPWSRCWSADAEPGNPPGDDTKMINQCAQLWYVKVMGLKDDLDDLVLVWSCIYVLVEIPRISYVTTSSKYELMQFSHLTIVEFQSKPFFFVQRF